MEDEVKANAQLKLLDEHLSTIREAAANVQRKRQDRRSSAKPEAGHEQYAVGDFVLKRRDMSQFKSGKLSANYFGPYQVVTTYKADVTVKDLLSDAHFVFHMDDLKPFVGVPEKAYARALTDADQFVIEKIVAYKGEPLKRSTTSFLVRFQDGDERWLPYKSVAEAAKLDEFCRTKTQLFPLLFPEKVWRSKVSELKEKGITLVKPQMVFYLDLNYWGTQYYESLTLPEKYEKTYSKHQK
jgi:hypothetical protein